MKTSIAFKSLLVLGVFSTIFTILFSFTLSNMMGPYIVGDLGGSNDIATYTLSFFGVGNAIGVPLGGVLPGRIGPRKFFVTCLLLFALFSWGCAISPTYPLLLFFRFLQGVVSGPIYALIPLVLRLIPQNKRSSFTACTITIFTVVPVFGACWGGWLAYNYHWQWGFTIETVIILLLALFLWIQLALYDFSAPQPPFNGISYFFYCVGLLSLSTIVIMGQELDWHRSPLIIALLFIGLPCFLFFLLWDWHHPYPLLKLRLLAKATISFALVNLALLFSTYFGTIILLAMWLNLDVTYTPIWIGYLLGIMGVIGFLPTILILEKFRLAYLDTRITLSIALIFFAISSFHTTIFNEDINFGRIALSRLTAGIGLAFFLPPPF